jgi:hypothetical protein
MEDSPSKNPAPFFAVSTTKFTVMSVFTFGIYEFYWFYWNWKLIRDRENSDISPFWRTVFAYFYCYPCFARVNGFAATKSIAASVPAGLLAAGWIVASLLWNLPGPFQIIGMFAFVPMLPVVTLTNEINRAVAPDHDPNDRFSFWNIFVIVAVVALVVLALFGLSLRSPSGVKQIALAAWIS